MRQSEIQFTSLDDLYHQCKSTIFLYFQKFVNNTLAKDKYKKKHRESKNTNMSYDSGTEIFFCRTIYTADRE